MSWGPVDVKRHDELKAQGIHLAVFIKGDDATNRCFFFDDRPETKVAKLFKHNQLGKPYIDFETGEPAQEEIKDFDIVLLKETMS